MAFGLRPLKPAHIPGRDTVSIVEHSLSHSPKSLPSIAYIYTYMCVYIYIYLLTHMYLSYQLGDNHFSR